MRGSLEVSSDRPIEMLALRGTINARGEFLISTLPVADYAAPASSGSLLFAHFADGGGYSTQTVLLDASDANSSATVAYFSQNGSATTVDLK
jgi:hypothetical protein